MISQKPVFLSLRGAEGDAAIQHSSATRGWAGLLRSRCSLAMTVLSMMAASPAYADVNVENQEFQSGLFAKANCKPEGTEGFNECFCLADVHVPVITGMKDAEKEKQLNAYFRSLSEKQKCAGTEADQETTEEPASSTYNFEVSFQSPAFLGLRLESWAFTGGAHGNGTVEGAIIDLANGKLLANPDIFTDLGALNKYIYDALSAEPEGEVFHDAIEGFGGVFLTPTECKSCTVLLTPEGVKVVFQAYAVSSFANGPMEVLITENMIGNATIKDTLKQQKAQPLPEQEQK